MKALPTKPKCFIKGIGLLFRTTAGPVFPEGY
jgi:hypothetical protein